MPCQTHIFSVHKKIIPQHPSFHGETASGSGVCTLCGPPNFCDHIRSSDSHSPFLPFLVSCLIPSWSLLLSATMRNNALFLSKTKQLILPAPLPDSDTCSLHSSFTLLLLQVHPTWHLLLPAIMILCSPGWLLFWPKLVPLS